jgi:hypothetical protein
MRLAWHLPHKTKNIFRSTILLYFLYGFGMINNVYSGTNDAVLSSQELGIPEPLVFDLVRPLNSPKGELEINALINRSSQTGEFSWAPEFEYAFSDGYAVELELPFENSTLEEYKIGLQGTFGELLDGRMIHGWQALGRYGRHKKKYSADILYLNGIRLSNKWSTMNMVGIRHIDFGETDNIAALVNNNLFYHYSQSLTLGVELNSEINTRKSWHYRLTPQIHYSMSSDKAIQIGGGPSNLDNVIKTDWLVTVRIMQTF